MSSVYWWRSGLLTLFNRSSSLLFNLLGFILLVRYILSTHEYGIWTLYFTVTSLVEVSRNGLIKNALIKNLVQADSNEVYGQVFSASLLINFVFILSCYLVLLLGSPLLVDVWGAHQLTEMFMWYGVSALGLILFSQLEFLQQANMRFEGVMLATFTRNGTFFLVVVSLMLWTPGDILLKLVWGQALSIFLGLAVSAIFAKRFIKGKLVLKKNKVKELFHFGKYTLATNLTTVIYKDTDQMMIGAMISPSAVAIYNAAIKINSFAQVPSMAMAEIAFPKSVESGHSKGTSAQKYMYEKSVGVVLAILFPVVIGVLLFPKFIINTIAGPEYLAAAVVLQLTILYIPFIPFSRQFGVIIESIGKPKINSSIELGSAVLNLVLNYFFILSFGIMGAVYATLIARLLKLIIQSLVLKKMIRVDILNAFTYMFAFYREIPQLLGRIPGKVSK